MQRIDYKGNSIESSVRERETATQEQMTKRTDWIWLRKLQLVLVAANNWVNARNTCECRVFACRAFISYYVLCAGDTVDGISFHSVQSFWSIAQISPFQSHEMQTAIWISHFIDSISTNSCISHGRVARTRNNTRSHFITDDATRARARQIDTSEKYSFVLRPHKPHLKCRQFGED